MTKQFKQTTTKQARNSRMNRPVKQMPKRIMKIQPNIRPVSKINKIRRNILKNKQTLIGGLLKTGGSLVGGILGNSTAGGMIGAGISRIFGQGDYRVVNNTLSNGGPPAFADVNTGIRIHHREYISDVLSSVNFSNTDYKISPVNATLFPWLSKIAVNFEEYAFRGLVFYFNTTAGSAVSSTNNALGVVGMTTVYDPTDPAIGSKREGEDYAGCVSGVPSASLLHPVECKPRMNVLDKLYIQTLPITNPEDWKFYALGTLNLFTQGMQAAGINIGEFWVSYDIEFYKPKILPTGTVTAAASRITIPNATPCGVTYQSLGTVDLPQTSGNLGCYYTASNGAINIPAGTSPGYYYLNLCLNNSSAISYLYNTWTPLTANIVGQNYFAGNSSPLYSCPNAAATNIYHTYSLVVYKTDSALAQIQVAASTALSGTINGDMTVFKLPSVMITGVGMFTERTADSLSLSDEVLTKVLQKLKNKMLFSISESDDEIA